MTDVALVRRPQHTWIPGLVRKETLREWLRQESIDHVEGIHKEGCPDSHGRWEITIKSERASFAIYHSYGRKSDPWSLTHTVVRGNRGWQEPANLALMLRVITAVDKLITEDSGDGLVVQGSEVRIPKNLGATSFGCDN